MYVCVTTAGWLAYSGPSGRFTCISGHPSAIQVERRTGKVRRPKTDKTYLKQKDLLSIFGPTFYAVSRNHVLDGSAYFCSYPTHMLSKRDTGGPGTTNPRIFR